MIINFFTNSLFDPRNSEELSSYIATAIMQIVADENLRDVRFYRSNVRPISKEVGMLKLESFLGMLTPSELNERVIDTVLKYEDILFRTSKGKLMDSKSLKNMMK